MHFFDRYSRVCPKIEGSAYYSAVLPHSGDGGLVCEFPVTVRTSADEAQSFC
jgi:hypothetical protein